MATMTMQEAEHILDVAIAALQEESPPPFHPISSLRGYDVFQIDMALKLWVANEFLILSERDDFEKQFAEGIQLYDPIPLHIVTLFVADDEIAKLRKLEPGTHEFKQLAAEISPTPLDSSTMTFKDDKLASLETVSSFGDYCKSIGPRDPIYWQKIYTRIGLEYTSQSPRGNKPAQLS